MVNKLLSADWSHGLVSVEAVISPPTPRLDAVHSSRAPSGPGPGSGRGSQRHGEPQAGSAVTNAGPPNQQPGEQGSVHTAAASLAFVLNLAPSAPHAIQTGILPPLALQHATHISITGPAYAPHAAPASNHLHLRGADPDPALSYLARPPQLPTQSAPAHGVPPNSFPSPANTSPLALQAPTPSTADSAYHTERTLGRALLLLSFNSPASTLSALHKLHAAAAATQGRTALAALQPVPLVARVYAAATDPGVAQRAGEVLLALLGVAGLPLPGDVAASLVIPTAVRHLQVSAAATAAAAAAWQHSVGTAAASYLTGACGGVAGATATAAAHAVAQQAAVSPLAAAGVAAACGGGLSHMSALLRHGSSSTGPGGSGGALGQAGWSPAVGGSAQPHMHLPPMAAPSPAASASCRLVAAQLLLLLAQPSQAACSSSSSAHLSSTAAAAPLGSTAAVTCAAARDRMLSCGVLGALSSALGCMECLPLQLCAVRLLGALVADCTGWPWHWPVVGAGALEGLVARVVGLMALADPDEGSPEGEVAVGWSGGGGGIGGGLHAAAREVVVRLAAGPLLVREALVRSGVLAVVVEAVMLPPAASLQAPTPAPAGKVQQQGSAKGRLSSKPSAQQLLPQAPASASACALLEAMLSVLLGLSSLPGVRTALAAPGMAPLLGQLLALFETLPAGQRQTGAHPSRAASHSSASSPPGTAAGSGGGDGGGVASPAPAQTAVHGTVTQLLLNLALDPTTHGSLATRHTAELLVRCAALGKGNAGAYTCNSSSGGGSVAAADPAVRAVAALRLMAALAADARYTSHRPAAQRALVAAGAVEYAQDVVAEAVSGLPAGTAVALYDAGLAALCALMAGSRGVQRRVAGCGRLLAALVAALSHPTVLGCDRRLRATLTAWRLITAPLVAVAGTEPGGGGGGDSLAAGVLGALGVMVGKTSGDGTAAAPLAMPRVSILQGAVAVAAEKAAERAVAKAVPPPPAAEAEVSLAAPRGEHLAPGLGRISDESDGAAAAAATGDVWQSLQLPGTPLPSPGNAASPRELTPLRVPSALVRQGLSAGGSRVGTPPGTPSGRRSLLAAAGGGGGNGGSGGSGGAVTPRSTSFARTDSGVSAASAKSVTVPSPTAHAAAFTSGASATSASGRLRPGSANSSSGGGSSATKPPLPRSALGQAAAPGQGPKPAAPASAAAEPAGEVQLSTVAGSGAATGQASGGKAGKGSGSMRQKSSEGVAAAGPASPYYPPPAARRNQVAPSPPASAPLPTLPDTVLLVYQPSYAEGTSISAPQDPTAAGDDTTTPPPAAAETPKPDAPIQPQAGTGPPSAAPVAEDSSPAPAPAPSAPPGPPHRSNSPAAYAPDMLLSSADISFAHNTIATAQADTAFFASSGSGGVGGPAEQLVLQLQSLLLRPAARAPAALVLVQLARGAGVRGSAALAMGWSQLVEAIKGSITSVYSDATQGQQQQQQVQPRWRQEEGQKRGPRGTSRAPGYRSEPVRRGSAGFLAAALDSLSYGASGPYGDLDEHDLAALLEALEVVAGGCVDGREALARDQPHDGTAAAAQYANVVLNTLHTQYESDSDSDIDVGYCGGGRKTRGSASKRPGGKRAAEEGPQVTLVEALAELACGWGPLADRLGAGRIAALEAQEQGQQGEEVLVRADTQVAASWRVPAKAVEAVAAAAAGVRSTAAGGGGQAGARRVLDTCRAHACRTLAWLVPQPSVQARLDAGGIAAELGSGLLVALSTTKDDDLRFAAVGLLRQLVSHAGAAHDALAHPACVVTAVEALEAVWHQHGQLISPAAAPRVIARPTTASSYAATARLAMGRPALLRMGSGNPSASPLSGHHPPAFPRNASFSSAGPVRSATQPMPSLSRPSGSGYGFHPPGHSPHGSYSHAQPHPAALLVAHSGASGHAVRGSKSGAHPALSGAAAGGVGGSLAGDSPHGVATRLSLASGACSDALRWTDPSQHAMRMLELAEEAGGGGGSGDLASDGLEAGSPGRQQQDPQQQHQEQRRSRSAAQPLPAGRPVSATSSNASGGSQAAGGGGGGGGGTGRTPRPSGTGLLEASGRLASVLPPLPAALAEENQLLLEVEAAGKDPLRAAALAAALAAAGNSNGGGRKRWTSDPFVMDDLLESARASREPGHTDSGSDSSEDEEEGRGSLVAAALLAGLRSNGSNGSGGRSGAQAERRGPRTLLPVQAGPAPVIPKTRSSAGAAAAVSAGGAADHARAGSPRAAGGPSTPGPVSGGSGGGGVGSGGGGVTAEAASQCAVRLVEVLTALAVDTDAARAMSTLPCFELFVDLAACRSPPLALAALSLLHRLAARQDTHETFWDCDAVAQLVAHVQRRSAAVSAAAAAGATVAAAAAAPLDAAAAAVQLRAAQVLERLAADPDLHGRLAATELPAALMAIVRRGAEPPSPLPQQAANLRDAAGAARLTGASPMGSMPASLDDRSVRGGAGAATAGTVALGRGLSRSSLAPDAGASSPSFSSPASSSLLACALSALCSLLDSPDVRRQARERRVPLHLGVLASASASGAAAASGGGGGGGDPLVAMLAAQCGEKLRADAMPVAGGGRAGLHVSRSAPQLPL